MGDRATINRAPSSMGFDRAPSSIRSDRASSAWPSASSVTASTRNHAILRCDEESTRRSRSCLSADDRASLGTRGVRATLHPDNGGDHRVAGFGFPLVSRPATATSCESHGSRPVRPKTPATDRGPRSYPYPRVQANPQVTSNVSARRNPRIRRAAEPAVGVGAKSRRTANPETRSRA